MKTFREWVVTESRSPTWVKVVVGGLILQLRGLSQQIQQTTDVSQQNKLLSKQLNLLSYITGMGIGFSSKDKRLQQYMRSLGRRKL